MNPGIESLPLRDIHLPGSVSWWPPAMGWWLVMGLLLAVVVIVLVFNYVKKRQQFSRVVLAEFDCITEHYQRHGDAQQLLQELSALMRRITITAFPERQAAGITGEAWLRFLDELAGEAAAKKASTMFNSPLGRWLISAPYQKRLAPGQQEVQQLLALCQEWIRVVSRRAHSTMLAGIH